MLAQEKQWHTLASGEKKFLLCIGKRGAEHIATISHREEGYSIFHAPESKLHNVDPSFHYVISEKEVVLVPLQRIACSSGRIAITRNADVEKLVKKAKQSMCGTPLAVLDNSPGKPTIRLLNKNAKLVSPEEHTRSISERKTA